MALNINGTTGISGVDGSASAPAIKGTDSNTGINFGTDTVNINTGGATRATVDSSGNLNIPDNGKIQLGTGNDLNILHTGSASEINNTTDTELQIKNLGNNGILLKNQNAYPLVFQTSAAERMRIDGSGNVLIGTTSLGSTNAYFEASSNSRSILHLGCGGTENSDVAQFLNPNGVVGTIRTNGSSTSFNTSSDYRLKENVAAISDGITRLKTLKPSRFNFKADATTTVDGFIAHEVTAVPEAIHGTKDAVDSDSKPVYQGIDQSKLVPLLTAALQEAIAKIETLETKVAALEAG